MGFKNLNMAKSNTGSKLVLTLALSPVAFAVELSESALKKSALTTMQRLVLVSIILVEYEVSMINGNLSLGWINTSGQIAITSIAHDRDNHRIL